MTGLRERHKADRDRRILQAAARLFREVGYQRAKIETIAEAAEVSIGTIYNYYQNKGDLLVAIVAMEVHEVLNAGGLHIARRHRSVAAAVDKLVAIYIEHSLVYLSKEMWRHAMAIAIEQPQSPFGKIYSGLDVRLAEQVCELLDRLAALGLVRPGSDTRSAGELIFNNLNMMFTTFVKSEIMGVRDVLRVIARQHAPVLQSLAVAGVNRRVPASPGRRPAGTGVHAPRPEGR